MITGYDSVYLAEGDPRVAIGRFLTAFRAEWPDMPDRHRGRAVRPLA
ncbi:hypothetical protein [Crossiella sp. NPDC003009]